MRAQDRRYFFAELEQLVQHRSGKPIFMPALGTFVRVQVAELADALVSNTRFERNVSSNLTLHIYAPVAELADAADLSSAVHRT